MTHRQTEDEQHRSPRIPDGGATESEINNDGAGSPDSNDSPPASSTRKKPRHSTCEITEEPPEDQQPQPDSTPQTPDSAAQEQRVYWFSQYLTLRLWRAVENFEVWDSGMVRAFREGPRSFADRVNGAARQFTRRLIGSGRTDIEPEAVTQSYLNRFRPRGLYQVCAKIFRKRKAETENDRPLKRKRSDSDMQDGFWAFTDENSSEKFKHRFLMAPPRLIVLSGPDKGIVGDVEMGE